MRPWLLAAICQARVDIEANQGEISVSGTIPHWVSEEYLAEQVRHIPGVRNVRTDYLTNLPPNLGIDV